MEIMSKRIDSIDILRGLTMFLMIFVNTSFAGVPWWMEHYPLEQNGMTFVDVIFPAFLLLVGISIPLAFAKYEMTFAGQSKLLWHLATRGISLLAMGLLMVNTPDGQLMGGNSQIWLAVACLGIFGVWHRVKSDNPTVRVISTVVRILSVVGLIGYCAYFKGANGQWMVISWWGILGLIGWAYISGGVVYFLLRKYPELLFVASFMFVARYLARVNGLHSDNVLLSWLMELRIDVLTVYPAMACFGAAIGAMILKNGRNPEVVIRWIGILIVLCAMTGYFFLPYGVQKNNGTPSWQYWSIGLTLIVYLILYYIADVKGYSKGVFNFFKLLGIVPLTAYVMHSMVEYAIRGCGGDALLDWGQGVYPILGFVSTLLFTCIISYLSVFLFKKGFMLKV